MYEYTAIITESGAGNLLTIAVAIEAEDDTDAWVQSRQITEEENARFVSFGKNDVALVAFVCRGPLVAEPKNVWVKPD